MRPHTSHQPYLDLLTMDASAMRSDCDVCIVGAGAAGLYLANRLAHAGLSVLLLEAGGRLCLDGRSIGIEAISGDGRYGATTEGRAFGLGGTTSRWGGQLIPHSEADLREPPLAGVFDPWRHIVDVVRKQAPAVHTALGLRNSADYHQLAEQLIGGPCQVLLNAGLATVAAAWLPFHQRNLRFLIEKSRVARERVRVVLHAAACHWNLIPDQKGNARVISVQARSRSGRKLEVAAQHFVIAAGALESARVLLEMQRDSNESLFPSEMAVGACLTDHLSCRVGRVVAGDARTAATLFGPRFRGPMMRSFKFVPTAAPHGGPRWCCHFVFDTDTPGFQLARKVLAAMQARELATVTPSELVRGMGGLIRLAENRLIRNRLFVPPGSAVYLQLNIEQVPRFENGVRLSSSLDEYGRPQAEVHWQIGAEDRRNIEELKRRFLAIWPEELLRITDVEVTSEDELLTKPHDVYHPVGTCRLGTDSRAVVDLDLRVIGVSNLAVLSTGVFPTAGSANPTFSMLCLGEQLAGRIANLDSQ